ncbi:hypothetical protein AAZX31_07G063400 [Glycine max]|nr:hypothetical protein JHK87_017666 [Glycine soja]KAG5036947.1 hypothetical protein JHK86_017787 [Glycine max]KAG5142029.1 hypothetical protein JHK82_017724 [Glycine max]
MADLIRPRPVSFDHALRGTAVTFNFSILYIQVRNMEIETNYPLHALVAFIFFLLLAFLQIRYPENPTPFQLHTKTTIVSIASFLVYCLAFLGRIKFTARVHHFDTLMQVFGSLSLVSLVLLLPPDTCESFGFIIYMLWFITHVLAMFRRFRTRFRDISVLSQQPRKVMRLQLPNTLTCVVLF